MRRQNSYRLQDFRGENNRDSIIHQGIFGRRGLRQVRALRGYHLIGHGRALSRQGYSAYVAGTINGAAAVQGLAMYEFRNTRHLVAVSNADIRSTQGSSWTDITGSVVQATGQDTLVRFTPFIAGETEYLLGTDGTNPPWKWAGTGNAEVLTGAGMPTRCVDLKEFHGYLFVMGPENDPSRIERSAYGTLDFAENNLIDCTRDSAGVGLAQHSRDCLLAFFERQTYRILFNTDAGPAFYTAPIETAAAEACRSGTSIASADGYTYWAAAKGIMRWQRGRPEYIGGPIEEVWTNLNRARDRYITAFVRGEPWNEVVWLVSYDESTKHNCALVYNTRLESWSVFPVSPFSGVQEFNVGCNWRDANGVERTILGDYVGVAHQAWGTARAPAGYSDNGSQIYTELTTGFINFDYPGISAVRNCVIDLELPQDMAFDVVFNPGGTKPTRLRQGIVAGTDAKLIDGGFMVDVDYVQQASISSLRTRVNLSSRHLQTSIMRTAADNQHVVVGITWMHLPRGMREE